MPEMEDKKAQSLTIYMIKSEVKSVDNIIDAESRAEEYDVKYKDIFIGKLFVKKRLRDHDYGLISLVSVSM